MTQASHLSHSSTRNILLLQGIVGPFFQNLAIELRKAGHHVWKINFNGGDCLFWTLPHGIVFRGQECDWPTFLVSVLKKHHITDIMLFGDVRYLHRVAIKISQQENIHVHVFEEGYVRPGWITLETDGTNGFSHLPKTASWYLRTASQIKNPSETTDYPASFRRRALESLAYNTADILTRWYFRHWQHYRPATPWEEGRGWIDRTINKKDALARSLHILKEITDHNLPFMIFPLQLDSDSQVLTHSDFNGLTAAISSVIISFARHAPKDLCLIIREHPYDNGIKDWRRLTRHLSTIEGVKDRVFYVPYGDLQPIVKNSQGMITINSTTGMHALRQHIPVKVLGKAVYDIEGITDPKPLHEFWSHPTPPKEDILDAFIKVVTTYCLIPGDYFSSKGMESAMKGILKRLNDPDLQFPKRLKQSFQLPPTA